MKVLYVSIRAYLGSLRAYLGCHWNLWLKHIFLSQYLFIFYRNIVSRVIQIWAQPKLVGDYPLWKILVVQKISKFFHWFVIITGAKGSLKLAVIIKHKIWKEFFLIQNFVFFRKSFHFFKKKKYIYIYSQKSHYNKFYVKGWVLLQNFEGSL